MTRLTVNTDPLKRLDQQLAGLDARSIQRAEVKAVNIVVQRTYDRARRRMIAGINLPDSYLRERMSVLPASDRPQAIIRARYVHTTLGRYSPKVIAAPASTSGKGDALRGIPPGLKSAGVSVEVTRGSRKPLRGAFIMPLKNGNGLGVFVRDPGRKSPRILFGPSVYQLFRATVGGMTSEIQEDLEATVFAQLATVVRA